VLGLTTYQIEQLLKLLPAGLSCQSNSTVSPSTKTDEELDYNFVGTAICLHAEQKDVVWVINTGATDHMISLSHCLTTVTYTHHGTTGYCIKLPNGSQEPVTHIGDVKLCNGLVLKDTMVVPDFKYNLLSVHKLCKDNNCIAIFHDEVCLI